MKILVATRLTQGTAPTDYHYCVEGELVWMQEPCDRDLRDPAMPCGCGRGFAGAASHRATTTAMVVDTELTRDDVVLAFKTSLVDGGWPSEWAEAVADENLEIAAQLPVGTIIVRNLEKYFLRGALFGGDG
ncbi:DUF7715 family protein [Mycobacterium sp. IDR2000157661]|uniref:DUF7715 family protein n=1 Tax=Mycobacterium sp. IDR2000157661 TaxID=2867005 RepID=UPI001EEB0995|nr:hypothetical protein [Mycobacterium sp. IDR2000157661]ULE34463.1 hypothetical protein K3G64_07515 [Mycobacterium sp. IDR2000157661]